MSKSQLTIRNLTATPLALTLVERFEAPDSLQQRSESIFTNVTSIVTSNATTPARPHLAESALSFAKNEVNIRVAPFTTQTTDIEAKQAHHGNVVRLTFEAEGERYRIDTPSFKNESQTLSPLVPQPKFQFTGVHVPEDSYLTIYSSANLQCWMQHLKDATPLSALSMPGTHNSPTCHRALPSVRCQAVSPRVQLDNGVRFFDIRVQPEAPNSPNLVLVHGVFPISLTGPKHFRSLVDDVYAFLNDNPSESLVMSVKREGTGNLSDEQLGRILHDHYTTGGDAHRWYVDPAIPTLSQVRGKIVLMRRFRIDDRMHAEHGSRGWAIDAECWADNTATDLHGSVCVQDFYQVLETENVQKKLDYAEAHLQRAAACMCPLPGITTDKDHPVPPDPFYLNFLSASNFWKVGCWPEKIARKLNPAIVKWLCCKHAQDKGHVGDGGTGIVVCDWVGADGDWDLVRCIVGMNARLMAREMAL